MTIYGCIVACQPKPKNGYKLTVIDNLGLQQYVHSFENYAYYCNFNSIWHIEVERHDGFNAGYAFHFFTLVGKPRQIGSLDNSFRDIIPEYLGNPLSTNGIYQGIQRYQANPNNKRNLDHTFVWNRRKKIVADVNSIHKGSRIGWVKTYQDGAYLTAREEETRQSFLNDLKASERSYGNRVNYYRRPLTNSLDDSAATLLLQKDEYNELTVSDFPKTGIKFFVDSIAAQVALREGHIAEFFTYFAILTYLKATKTYPTASLEGVTDYLKTYLSTYRQKRVKALLMGCARAGFIRIDGDELRLLSQQEYVRKCEAAHNARVKNATKQYGPGIKKISRKPGVDAYIPYKELPTCRNQTLHVFDNPEIYKMHRPYFTFYAYRSAELDTGFSHLINAHHAQMRAFLYELVVSSFNKHPICRTMIAANLGIPKATQVLYEKANKYLEKHTNHTEIPEDMLNALSPQARETIQSAVYGGGKFKRSHSGKIYRQEGNSYRSNRIKWISTPKTARLKLSRRIIRLWRAVEPVFRDGFSDPSLQDVPQELLAKEKLTATYVRKKTALSGSYYFALLFTGVIIPTTNKKHWQQFEPLARYDRATGDRILPSRKSLWDVDERISMVERDVELGPTKVLVAPIRGSELSSHGMR